MPKKRTFYLVLNEILPRYRKGEISYEQLEELFSLAKTFTHFHEGYSAFIHEEFPEWKNKFFQKMIATAKTFSDWFWVIRASEQNTPEWNSAVEKALENAWEPGNILDRWKRMRSILPKDHPEIGTIREKIYSIQKERKEKRPSR